MSKIEMTPEQAAVVTNRGGTLLVSAAAGSGKTRVLVERVLARLQEEHRNITDFLIITFTNAAAAELRSRISEAISQAVSENPSNKHMQRQQSLIHLAQISTVHSFCASLIREYGYLLEIPSDYVMLDENEGTELLSQLLEDLLEEEYTAMRDDFRALADMFRSGRSDKGMVEQILVLHDKVQAQPFPEQWLESQSSTIPDGTELKDTLWGSICVSWAEKQVCRLLERFRWAIAACASDERLEDKCAPEMLRQEENLKQLLAALQTGWDAVAPVLEIEFPRWNSPRNFENKPLLEEIKRVRDDMKSLIKDQLLDTFSQSAEELIAQHNTMAPAMSALYRVTLELGKRFSAEKRRRNVLDFSDQEHLAIQLLLSEDGSPSSLAREVSKKYCEIMVDEYQDSNRVQEAIYTAIAADNDTNRFLVGDVKQSIYGFREAEPGMFREKYQSYSDAETLPPQSNAPRKLVLSKNFRSRPEILEAANHVFTCVMSKELGELAYGPREQLYQGRDNIAADGNCHVELNVLLTDAADDQQEDTPTPATKATKYQQEAAWTARKICTILESGLPVTAGEGTRPVCPEDIAILMRSTGYMPYYRKALEKLGIPVRTDNGGNLFDTTEIKVVMNFLRVADNPHQDIPLLAVLCSPVFRFSNELLAQLRLQEPQLALFEALCQSEGAEFQNAAESIAGLRKLAGGISADELVWHVLHETGLLTTFCAMENGRQRYENLLSFYEYCRSVASGKHIYLYELLRALERAEKAGRLSASANSGGVTITTIHKSKGLEYPVVFLCDLAHKFNFKELYNDVLFDGDAGLAPKIVDTKKRLRYPGIAFRALGFLRKEKLRSEEMRVLYVAMTRPQDYLFMNYTGNSKLKYIKDVISGVGKPAEVWAAEASDSLGKWVLLAAMNRLEAGELFTYTGRPFCELTVSPTPWGIHVVSLEEALADDAVPCRGKLSTEAADAGQNEVAKTEIETAEALIAAISWSYDHAAATQIPSKLTATELKGRAKDTEVAEGSGEQRPVHTKTITMERPEFILSERSLTATEKGTASHMFLQYADYSELVTLQGIEDELVRMVDEEFLTQQQADAVVPEQILKLFHSEIGQQLLKPDRLLREYKFSLMTDAGDYYPELAGQEEKILMQGVIDAAVIEPDGITVVDFKTDHVYGAAIAARAKTYEPQVNLYRRALERITGTPVKTCVLYFLSAGEAVYI